MTNRANKLKKKRLDRQMKIIDFASRKDNHNVLQFLKEENARFERENPVLAAQIYKIAEERRNSDELKKREEFAMQLLVKEDDVTEGITLSYDDGVENEF